MLEIDLNKYVSDEIKKEIQDYKQEIQLLSDKNIQLKKRLHKQEEQIQKCSSLALLSSKLKDKFNSIKNGESDRGGWYDSKAKKQYYFINKILSTFFNITEEYGGWKSSRSDGSLKVYLAVNYYQNKDILISLLDVLLEGNDNSFFYEDTKSYIRNFKMPFDKDKEFLKKYLINPTGNTNGANIGVSQYWINAGAEETSMPHDLMMKHPNILDEDIFPSYIDVLKRSKGSKSYLLELPNFNRNISEQQLQELGECLLSFSKTAIGYSNTEKFINIYLKRFNKKTLDFLYQGVTTENQYNTLHWEKFPVDYQKKYLLSKDFEVVERALFSRNCQWTKDEKTSFLKIYFKEPETLQNRE